MNNSSGGNYRIFYLLIIGILITSVLASVGFAASISKNGGTFASTPFSGSDKPWINTSSAQTSNNNYTTTNNNLDNNEQSQYLNITNFNFNVPVGSIINGIQVRVERSASSVNDITDLRIRLIKNGTIGATDRSNTTSWGTSDSSVIYGGPNDLWGTNWTVSEINSAATGFVLAADSSGNNVNAKVDYVNITVFYTPPPNLTVTKIVVNNNGGTKIVSNFSLFVNSTSVTSGQSNLFTSGVYAVSETQDSGYSATFSGNCSLNGQITLNPGDVKTCTITNDDRAANLIIVKNVVNDNGGTKSASDFTMNVTASNPSQSIFFGSAVGTNITLNAGSYSVDETFVSGYAKSLSADCSGTIGNGETKFCTITNDDIAPKLTVTKIVVNDNGGDKQAADFPLFVNATQVTSGIQYILGTSGPYALSETSQQGYSASSWTGDCASDGTITLNLGDEKSCTITNDDVAPTLTLNKIVINNNGGNAVVSDFPLFVNGNSVTSGAPNNLLANTLYTLTETTQSGYSPSAWSGDCAPNGTITLLPGDNKVCNITNDDVAASITLTKSVTNDNGGNALADDFGISVGNTLVLSGSTTFVDSNTPIAVNEIGLSGYTFSNITGGAKCPSVLGGTATLDEGESISCTIANNDVSPSITLTKSVTNDHGGISLANDFGISVDGNAVLSGSTTNVNANTPVAINEAGLSGYSFTSITGGVKCPSVLGGTATLEEGETISCTITNDDIPAEIAGMKFEDLNGNGVKDQNENGVFGWTINLNGTVSNSTVTDADGNYDFTGIPQGTYSITETMQEGWVQSLTPGSVIVANGEISLNNNFGNFKISTINVNKNVVSPDNSEVIDNHQFTIRLNGINSSSVSESGAVSYSGLAPGVYTISEDADSDYEFVGFNLDEDSNTPGAQITLTSGSIINLTVTNKQKNATVTIVKDAVPDDSQDFEFTGGFGAFSLDDDNDGTLSNTASFSAVPGDYSVSETPVSGFVTNAVCNGSSTIGSIQLTSNKNVLCTFTNVKQPKLTVNKVIINDNGGMAQISDVNLFINSTEVSNASTTTLSPGSYVVSESGMPGYSSTITGDCSSDGSIELSPGDEKQCTIINDDVAAKLTVTKIVTNDNGGTKEVSDFTLFVNSTPVLSGNESSFAAGHYIISELEDQEYVFSISGDCASDGTINLGLGDVKSCTITNNDKSASLLVFKHVINDNGGVKQVSDFTLFINSTQATSGLPNTLKAGEYLVSETADSGYSSLISGDCESGGKITLSLGEAKSCTITNDDKSSSITVTKIVINDDGGKKQVSDFTLFVNQTQVSSGIESSFSSGAYKISELSDSGYSSVISGDCDSEGNVNVALGESKECTITNDDIAPKLTVTKIVVNDNEGNKTVGDFTLFVNSTVVTSGVENMLNAGSYVVSELMDPGYSSTITGDCNSDGSITLLLGEIKNCAITNDDIKVQKARLKVTKVVINDNGGTKQVPDFVLFVNSTEVVSEEVNTFAPGFYSVGELADSGYSASISGDCSPDGTITLADEDSKECTITNDDRQGTLTVFKKVKHDDGGKEKPEDFTITVDGVNPSQASFSGNADGTIVTLDAGAYSVDELFDPRYSNSFSLDCSGIIANGESRNCTVTNDDIPGKLIVIKNVINDNGGTKVPSDFTIKVQGANAQPNQFSGSAQGTEVTLNVGDYEVSEHKDDDYNPSFSENCTGEIGNGETKTCIVTNDDIGSSQATLTVTKRVKNNNGGNKTVTDFILKIDNTVVISGQSYAVNPGLHIVSELADPDYEDKISGDCDENGEIFLEPGDDKECIITNDDVKDHGNPDDVPEFGGLAAVGVLLIGGYYVSRRRKFL